MEIKIEWSHQSIRQLRNIFNYYSQNASPKIAQKITNKIIKKVEILLKNPSLGQKEELLTHSPENYRYLVESNYTNHLLARKNTLIIASVFDCRQNPIKIKKMG